MSKQSLLKAAKCVGITATGLNVNFMQTEKIEQAAGILEGNNNNEVPETPKRTETNVWVAQVCGSMQGKDMLEVVKSIRQ